MSMYDALATATTLQPTGLSPFYRHFSSEDIDEHAEHVSNWQLTYDQMSAGRFHGELAEFNLGWMHVIRDKTNQSLIKRGSAKPGTVNFSIPLSFRGELYCNGNLVSEGKALVANAEDLPQLRTPHEMDLAVVTVDKEILERELTLQGIAFESRHLPKMYQLKGLAVPQSLRSILENLEHSSINSTGDLNDDRLHHQFRDAIMLQLFELLPSSQPMEITPSARKRTVDRACEYALTHLDEPLSILDLCRTLGASRRKLQYCFQETLGTNPVAYLRTLRLNAARRELRQGTNLVSVQDVASRWGFWHLSRFSSEYRAMFGESPSQTLHR